LGKIKILHPQKHSIFYGYVLIVELSTIFGFDDCRAQQYCFGLLDSSGTLKTLEKI